MATHTVRAHLLSRLCRNAAIPALLALLAACGTTVGGGVAGGAGALSAPGSAASTGGAISGAEPGSTAAGGVADSGAMPAAHAEKAVDSTPGSVATGPGAQAQPGTTAVTVGGNQTGQGYDARHVYMGFNTINDLHTAAKSTGFGGLDYGDMKSDAEALIAEMNDEGGVLGRRLVGVYHDEATGQATTQPSANAQATCAAFTQDTKVAIAAINDTAGDENDTFYGCMSAAHTPFLSGADLAYDQQRINQYRPYLYPMQTPAWDYLAPVLVQRLKAQNYFSPWDVATGTAGGTAPTKLGLLFEDSAAGHHIATLIEHLAAGFGIPTYAYFYADPANGLGTWESSIQQSVLLFRSNGATHIVPDASAVIVFAVAAEQQHYRPRYGVNSLNVLYTAAQDVPQGQFNGALGVGWIPIGDLGYPQGSEATWCLNAMRRRGVQYKTEDPIYVQLNLCDDIRLFVAAATAAGSFAPTALPVGLAKIGHTFRSAVTFRSAYSSTRVDLPGGVRDVAYHSGCTCFTYTNSTVWPF